jgi:ABC-2 type transport system permease protein
VAAGRGAPLPYLLPRPRLRRLAVLLAGRAREAFLAWVALRGFVVTLVANQAVPPLIGLAVWTTALPGRPELAAYFVALLLVRLLTVSYENHTFSNGIYAGGLTADLLLPCPVVLQPLGTNLALRAWHALVALPLLLAAALLAPARPAGPDVLLAVPALLLAAAVRFVFSYTLALTAFWTQRAHAVVEAGDVLLFLLGGEAAPVPLLPEAVRPWAAALPFRAMLGFPAEVAAGLAAGPAWLAGYGWQVVWLAVLVPVAAGVWRAGLRRYTAVGG